MSYRRDRPIRDVYEERCGERNVPQTAPYQRIVSIERRPPLSRPKDSYSDYDYGGDFDPAQRYAGSRGYAMEEHRGFHEESGHVGKERRLTSPAYKKEEPLVYYRGSREDVSAGNQGDYRSASRLLPQSSVRGPRHPHPPQHSSGLPGRGDDTVVKTIVNLPPPHKGPLLPMCERSSGKMEVTPSPHSRSGSSVTANSRSYSPDIGKTYSYQSQLKRRYEEPSVKSRESVERERLTRNVISTSQEEHSQNPVLSAKPLNPVQEAVSELPCKQEDFLTEMNTESLNERRAHAIASRALEIEKIYRQDCETFGAVVKMLVSKDPGLEKQLQGPLTDSLVEIRERCLEDLRLFIDELDEEMFKQDTVE